MSARKGHDRIAKFLSRAHAQRAPPPPSVLDGPAKLAERMRERQSQSGGRAEQQSLRDFLTSTGVDKYADLFVEKGVTMDKLVSMTDQVLVASSVDSLFSEFDCCSLRT